MNTGHTGMDLGPALETFVAESRELLEQMERDLLRLEVEPGDGELLDSVFRAAHTIKGSAGVFGFDGIVDFTHRVETVLDRLRNGEATPTAELVALLLRCGDQTANMVRDAVAGTTPDPEAVERGLALLSALEASAAGGSAPPADVTPEPADDAWRISLRFGRDVLRNGMDPLSFVRYLGTLGRLLRVETDLSALPPRADYDPEACYLALRIELVTDADKATIDGAFDFVRDECEIAILAPADQVRARLEQQVAAGADTGKLGSLLVASGALTESELHEGLRRQVLEESRAPANGAPTARPLGEILIDAGVVAPAVVATALERQQQARGDAQAESRLIRVDAAKLDQLITLVGELVIAGAGTQALAARAGLTDIVESAAAMAGLVEEVRDSALGMRMVQIGATFQRFHRVVRDVSRDLGKDIELVVRGGETELDKSLVEKIGDPLMHLVRNAMDHGIEPAQVRLERGKPARARVGLSAWHDSGSVVIEVQDDGGGLDRDRILRKAVERGLVAPGAELTDAEIFRLVFEPGFSTAEAVSNLSGRGVGMDVVRRNIEALRGTVHIDSAPGVGTRVRVRLPLTLAIIDGFLVGVGAARYVVPLDAVVECIELPADDRAAVGQRGYINLRGSVLPVLRLRDAFEIEAQGPRRENVVVVRFGDLLGGLIVDELLGEHQTVIKPLGRLFAGLQAISGSTILGTGEVALILDVSALIQRSIDTRQRADAGATGRSRAYI